MKCQYGHGLSVHSLRSELDFDHFGDVGGPAFRELRPAVAQLSRTPAQLLAGGIEIVNDVSNACGNGRYGHCLSVRSLRGELGFVLANSTFDHFCDVGGPAIANSRPGTR
jgi:hypothetical protein